MKLQDLDIIITAPPAPGWGGRKAVAGNKVRARGGLLTPQAPERYRCSQNSRLSAVSAIQICLGAILAERPQIIAQRIGGFGKGVLDDGVLFSQLTKHANRLRTLTGKNKAEGIRHIIILLSKDCRAKGLDHAALLAA